VRFSIFILQHQTSGRQRAVQEAAGVVFTNCDKSGGKLEATKARKGK
jgi:hypothetical protein